MDQQQYIKDFPSYSLGKDIEGKKHFVKELQERILEAILEIDRVCYKNNIPYALAFGSALGLVNYGTFTPWDDDADIVIDYFDIPRFIKAFEKDLNKDKYVLEGYEINQKYNVLIPTFKLRIKNTYQKEANWFWLPSRCGNGHGFFVDICAFMGVPENEKEHRKILKKGKRAIIPYTIMDAIFRIHPMKLKKRLKKYEGEIAEKYKDSPYVSQSVIIPWQDMPKIIEHNSFPKEIIYPFKQYLFAGHQLYSFNNPEEFVRLRYGEKFLKQFVDGHWIDPIPKKSKVVWHTKKYSLSRDK